VAGEGTCPPENSRGRRVRGGVQFDRERINALLRKEFSSSTAPMSPVHAADLTNVEHDV